MPGHGLTGGIPEKLADAATAWACTQRKTMNPTRRGVAAWNGDRQIGPERWRSPRRRGLGPKEPQALPGIAEPRPPTHQDGQGTRRPVRGVCVPGATTSGCECVAARRRPSPHRTRRVRTPGALCCAVQGCAIQGRAWVVGVRHFAPTPSKAECPPDGGLSERQGERSGGPRVLTSFRLVARARCPPRPGQPGVDLKVYTQIAT